MYIDKRVLLCNAGTHDREGSPVGFRLTQSEAQARGLTGPPAHHPAQLQLFCSPDFFLKKENPSFFWDRYKYKINNSAHYLDIF